MLFVSFIRGVCVIYILGVLYVLRVCCVFVLCDMCEVMCIVSMVKVCMFVVYVWYVCVIYMLCEWCMCASSMVYVFCMRSV